MLEIEHNRYGFRTKEIWFSRAPFDVSGYDAVAFHACTEDVDPDGFSKRPFTTPVIDLTRDTDAIFRKMDKKSCRDRIKKAERQGIEILVDRHHQEFYDLYSTFRRLKDLPPYDITVDFMKRYGTLFVSLVDGGLLGGLFTLHDDAHMRVLIMGSRRLEQADGPKVAIDGANRLTFWTAMQYAKDRGIGEFDLGGYYTGETPDPQMEGINRFKRGFGPEIVTHYIYQKDYSKACTLARRGYKAIETLRNGLPRAGA